MTLFEQGYAANAEERAEFFSGIAPRDLFPITNREASDIGGRFFGDYSVRDELWDLANTGVPQAEFTLGVLARSQVDGYRETADYADLPVMPEPTKTSPVRTVGQLEAQFIRGDLRRETIRAQVAIKAANELDQSIRRTITNPSGARQAAEAKQKYVPFEEA